MPERPSARPGSSTPHPYPSLVRLEKPLAALSFIVSVRYLWWRAAHTLNYETTLHLAISITLLVAEIYGFVSMALFFMNSSKPEEILPAALPPEAQLPSVDVLVTIYNEPLDILERTLVGCRALDYPRRKFQIYVLDDGSRAEVRALAERMGCRYLTRPDRKHAKAGNINFGLEHSDGDLVMIMDCDHVPVRSFLTETVGFFQDPKMGFVQMPHHFYNPDTFQRNLHLEGALAHEQDLFFRFILPGRTSAGATMFCGSSAILRRSALEELGGLKTQTAIEDTHTGMRVLAKGYKALYYPRILSGALSPESFKGYLIQRGRWTRGGIQLFLLDNPLFVRGLTLRQRLHYLSSTFYFFHGLARVVFLLAPLTFLVFSLNPIVANVRTLLWYFLPHYIASHMLLSVMGREFRTPLWSEVYEAASSFYLSWMALITLLNPIKLVFRVTPKGEEGAKSGRVHWTFVIPHVTVLVLVILGVIKATWRAAMFGLQLDAYLVSGVWAGYNMVLLACAIETARERARLRKDYRLERSIACELLVGSSVLEGHTLDLSESGVSLKLADRWYLPKKCRVRLLGDYGEETLLDGEVVREDWPKEGGTRVGLRFPQLSEALRQGVIRQIFSSPSSWDLVRSPQVAHAWKSYWQVATSGLQHRFRGKLRPTRSWPRVAVQTACEVSLSSGGARKAFLQDVSATGASFLLASLDRVPSGAVTLRFPIKGSLTVVRGEMVRGEKSRDGVRCTMRFIEPSYVDVSPLAPKTRVGAA